MISLKKQNNRKKSPKLNAKKRQPKENWAQPFLDNMKKNIRKDWEELAKDPLYAEEAKEILKEFTKD